MEEPSVRNLVSADVFKTIEYVKSPRKDSLLELFDFLKAMEDHPEMFKDEYIKEFALDLKRVAGTIASVESVVRLITNQTV